MNGTYSTRCITTNLGDTIEIFENDLIGQEIVKNGQFAQDELDILTSLFSMMPFRRACLDIGANIGTHSALFAKHFEETHAVEPHFEVFSVLSGNIERNGWKAKAYNTGISDQNGTLKLSISEDGNFGRTSFAFEYGGRTVDVAVIQGDTFIEKHVSSPVDFIKIDAESFEGPIISGLKKTIQEFQPVISLEWNNQITRDYFQQHELFATILNGYYRMAMYKRWSRDLWPGIIGRLRRKINKPSMKKDHVYCLIAHIENKDSESVILIPPKLADLIAPLQNIYPLISI